MVISTKVSTIFLTFMSSFSVEGAVILAGEVVFGGRRRLDVDAVGVGLVGVHFDADVDGFLDEDVGRDVDEDDEVVAGEVAGGGEVVGIVDVDVDGFLDEGVVGDVCEDGEVLVAVEVVICDEVVGVVDADVEAMVVVVEENDKVADVVVEGDDGVVGVDVADECGKVVVVARLGDSAVDASLG